MKKYETITAKVMPINIKDVDTDMIIPAQFLTSTSREGFGENLFRRLRDADPNFPTNQEKYKSAKIIVAGDNFGCGSSREHAVWALQSAGFDVVISTSFADIFYSNSQKNGLLLVKLPQAVVSKMLIFAESGEYEVRVDLANQTVSLPDGTKCQFDYDPFRKYCLLEGLDDVDYILSQKLDIEKFRKGQKSYYSTV